MMNRTWKTWQLLVAALVALLIGVGIGASGSSDEEPDATTQLTSQDDPAITNQSPVTTTEATTTTQPENYHPAPADFQLTVVEIEKSCFGSAGCHVTYEVDLAYTGPRPLDPSDTWLVIYELLGGEDQKIGSMEVQGERFRKDSDSASTSSSSSKLTAKPTTVRPA